MSLGGENMMLETPGAVLMAIIITIAIARFGLADCGGHDDHSCDADVRSAAARPRRALRGFPSSCSADRRGDAAWAFRVAIGTRPLFAGGIDDWRRFERVNQEPDAAS